MRTTVLSVVAMIFLFSIGCKQEKEPFGVLARVDGTVITLEDTYGQRIMQLMAHEINAVFPEICLEA